ncbi:hypothetical protein RJ640_015929 [Escallonia rubra]|uniref:Uncharacterized protein n=1 Tax=Escallonia rubra TaxID=112253 RepID=A0AA88R8S1_9ASTE|nr:hypothetical protein RJ640_015929 [Escallonia rubra]
MQNGSRSKNIWTRPSLFIRANRRCMTGSWTLDGRLALAARRTQIGELLEAEEVGEAGQGEVEGCELLPYRLVGNCDEVVGVIEGFVTDFAPVCNVGSETELCVVGDCSVTRSGAMIDAGQGGRRSDCSSSQLRRLRLAYCDDRFSSGAFIEAFKNLPLLEDIHIYYTSISKEAIEVAGHFRPLNGDDEALAIAENMPGMRRLQLIGNKLTNSGLQAVLDRCHRLESLDLRQCLNVNIGGDIRKICSERIKELRSPYDSMEDYPFAAVIWGACYDGHEDWLGHAIHGLDQDGPSANSNHGDYRLCFSMQFTIRTSLDWLGLVVEVLMGLVVVVATVDRSASDDRCGVGRVEVSLVDSNGVVVVG